jgi:hypothetical protein
MAPSSSPSAAPPQPSSDNPPPTSPPPPHPQPSILRLPPSPCRLPPPSRLEMPSRTGFTSVLPPRRMPLRGAGRSLLSRSSMTKVKPRQWRLLRFHPSMWWDLAAAPGSRRRRGVVAVDSWPTRTAQLATLPPRSQGWSHPRRRRQRRSAVGVRLLPAATLGPRSLANHLFLHPIARCRLTLWAAASIACALTTSPPDSRNPTHCLHCHREGPQERA